MTEPSDAPSAPLPAAKPSQPAPLPRGLVLSYWAIALLAGCLVAAGLLAWQQLRLIQADLAKQQTAAAQAALQLRQGLDTLTARIDHFESSQQALTGKQALLEQAMQTLEEQVQRDAGSWVVAEAEYLMRIANLRLRLARDSRTATAALEAADARLQRLEDPSLFEVRRRLSEEIAALRALPEPDVTGAALALAQLAARAERIPAAGSAAASARDETEAVPEVHDWRGVLRAIWGSISELVSVRRQDQAGAPMLAPEQRYFLHQNLALKLQEARLALLRGEGELYRTALRSARTWLQEHFDTSAAETVNAINTLTRLERAELAPDLPDISGSLLALEQWMERRGRRPSGAPSSGGAQL